MFAYHLPDGLPAGSRTVWSQLSLQPLTAQPLTPFSYSILDEVAKSAWYHYFDELGFEPMPRSRVLRQQQGRAYLNLTLSAQRDAEAAAVEPLRLEINGQPFALAKWEKPGFLAGIKLGRNRKKINQVLAHYAQEITQVTQTAAAWHLKTQELRWTQADILQVMEEVERMSIASFKIFLAARHNLELLYNRLFWLTRAQQPFPANLALIQQALGVVDGLYEMRIAEAWLALGAMARVDPGTLAWLQAKAYADWQTTLPNQALAAAVGAFLQQYGHRCGGEGEIRQARWQENPALLLASLAAHFQPPAPRPAVASQTQALLDALPPDQRKPVQEQLVQMRQLLVLQSQALHAFAYISAGTRHWALAAAKEAQSDQRLLAVDDVFFFQLEEVKQMMTGEWNISSRQAIQATCTQRKADYARWQTEEAPVLLIGDSAASPLQAGLPGAGGQATGPFHRVEASALINSDSAIMGVQPLDGGASLLLPFARAFVTATGTPLDPLVVAARAWQIPTVLGLGSQYQRLVEGAQTTVSGDSGKVEQSSGAGV